MKRTERILQDKKQNKISVKNGKPSSIDLKENELTIRNTEEGLFFYIKYNGAVYSRKLNKIDKSTNRLYLKEVVSSNRDTDKFLVLDSGEVKFRTGSEILSDISAISGVSITTDSGGGSKAEDTSGSADFSILGSSGVNVTNSGTTITATAVPAEIDHDSLNNFVANEHINHTSVTLTAGNGISGGGDISANRSFAVENDQTTIQSIINTSLRVGRDTHNEINFATDNEIIFQTNDVNQVYLTNNMFGPKADSDIDLGTTGERFKDAYVDSITVTGEVDADSLDIEGDADINGTLEADAITVGGTALNTVIAGVTVTNATNATNSDHISVADNENTDEDNLIPFIENASATGNVGLESDGDFHYNPSTGKVTATAFAGNLTGNVTGNASGSSGSCPGNAATATLASTCTVTDNSDAANKPIVFHDGSNALQDDATNFSFNPNTGIVLVPKVKLSSNIIQNSDGEDTITIDADQNVAVAGALKLGSGGLIQANDGGTSITVGDDDTATFAGSIVGEKDATITGPSLTSASTDDKLISATQNLNVSAGSLGTQKYRMIKTNLTEQNVGGWDEIYLIDQQVDGTSKFNVDNSGNARFLGTVTSSAGACSGTTFKHIIGGGFNFSYAAGQQVFLPLTGYVIELTPIAGRNEHCSFVAPYDGSLNYVICRSEEACGSTVVGFHKSTTGTEAPNATATSSITVDMTTDDTPYKFDFLSSNTFSAGDIIAISFDPTNDANDTNFTVELILDSSSGL